MTTRPLGRVPHSWLGAAAAVAVMPVALAVIAPAPVVAAAGHRTNGGWAGTLWSGSGTSGTGTTLKTVRTVIGADTGAAEPLNGTGVGIALIDTGVAPVPGLPAAQIVNGPDLSFESQATNLRYLDTYGHGTHMAGIMVANDTASGTVGLAPKAKVTSLKVGISNGAADVTQTMAAIDWVVKNRNHDPQNPIKVLNLSYSTAGVAKSTTDPLQFAIEKAWEAGITVVVSAGNNGTSTTSLTTPATDPYVIAVGSANTKGTTATTDDELSTFSSMSTGSRTVDLLAPGESIASLRVENSNADLTSPGALVGTTLFRGSGTSQATAVVSAAAALLLQKRPTLTPDQVKQALKGGGTVTKVGVAASKGLKEVNVNGAIAATVNTTKQSFTRSTGDGQLDVTRGGTAVWKDGTKLSGAWSIFGPFHSANWAAYAALKQTWTNAKPGVWMGTQMAGNGWTGTSFASKTWGAAIWPGVPWMGGASWIDPDWSGRTWSGRTWSGRTWSGRTWSSNYWSSNDWSTAHWG